MTVKNDDSVNLPNHRGYGVIDVAHQGVVVDQTLAALNSNAHLMIYVVHQPLTALARGRAASDHRHGSSWSGRELAALVRETHPKVDVAHQERI